MTKEFEVEVTLSEGGWVDAESIEDALEKAKETDWDGEPIEIRVIDAKTGEDKKWVR